MFKKTILKNGLRLLTIPVKGTDVITVLVLIKAGSRNEKAKLAGISHFAEHVFFKGTKKRPSQIAIASEIDGVGGEMNAFTSKEYTGFYIKASKDHFKLSLDVLADILQNPLFRPQDIKKEKGVIVQEINMYQDTPLIYVSELFEQRLYAGHPLGRDIIGSKNTVLNVSAESLRDYIASLYTADNVIVCVAGAIGEAKDLVKSVSDYFKFVSAEKVATFKKIIERQKEPQIAIKKQKTEQTHFCLGVRGYPADHPKRYILEVLSALLGGGMSSRLFEQVRDKRGLAYYIKSAVQTYKDCGYLQVQAGVEHQKMAKAILVILKELGRLKSKKVPQKELQKAKEFLKGSITLEIEDSFALAQLISLQELLKKKTRTPAEIFKEIDKVTAEDIRLVAEELFVNEGLNLAVIGLDKSESKIKKILKI